MPLTWENPPAPIRHGGKWATEANELRENPGRWARLVELETRHKAAVLASQIKTGTLKAFRPGGSFDARSRGPAVWAVYLSPETEILS